jgi:hypothetical protein
MRELRTRIKEALDSHAIAIPAHGTVWVQRAATESPHADKDGADARSVSEENVDG